MPLIDSRDDRRDCSRLTSINVLALRRLLRQKLSWKVALIGALVGWVATADLPVRAQGSPIAALSYLGKFSLPAGFDYQGRGLAFNPARQSLFVSGFMRSPLTAEVSIPAIGGTASILQGLTDPTEGRAEQVSPGDPNDKMVGGYLVAGDKLIVSVYAYYDAAGSVRVSHFVRPVAEHEGAGGRPGPGRLDGARGSTPATWPTCRGTGARRWGGRR